MIKHYIGSCKNNHSWDINIEEVEIFNCPICPVPEKNVKIIMFRYSDKQIEHLKKSLCSLSMVDPEIQEEIPNISFQYNWQANNWIIQHKHEYPNYVLGVKE